MAEPHPEGDEPVLHRRPPEKAEGIHGDIRVPLAAVTSVRVVGDAGPSCGAWGHRAPAFLT